jgi:hypothetical protein
MILSIIININVKIKNLIYAFNMRSINVDNFAFKNIIIYNYLNKYFLKLFLDIRKSGRFLSGPSSVKIKILIIALTKYL